MLDTGDNSTDTRDDSLSAQYDVVGLFLGTHHLRYVSKISLAFFQRLGMLLGQRCYNLRMER